jgi:hypothetical protein
LVLRQRMTVMPGFEVVPRPSTQPVILCLNFGNKKGFKKFFDIWGRSGFDGQETVMDGIPGFPDTP